MKKVLSLILLCSLVLLVFETKAQSYTTGVGLRAGYPAGITLKHFISERSALEGIATYRWQGVRFTGLYQLHNDIPTVDGLKWYVGIGGFASTANRRVHPGFRGFNNEYVYNAGVSGVIGLEYVFEEFPIAMSIDYMPSLGLFRFFPLGFFEGGFSVRYTF